ncbi:MAG TPA: sigma factor, partial [Actinomycetota bacterium]|nr:sigma factor [Actinomycetota bacterium]
MEEPEPAVVQAAMDGDLAAFERLVRSYQAHVWRFLRHLLGDAALAEDVTQETFLRLYQRLPTFAGRSRFS